MDSLKKPERKALRAICLLGLVYVLVTVADVALHFSDQVSDSAKLAIVVALCVIGFRCGRAFFEFTHTKTVFLISMSLVILIHITKLTGEFRLFGTVPLLRETTTAKRIYETTVMCGIVCSFLSGIYLSVSAINKARMRLGEAVRLLHEDRAQLKSLTSQLALVEERERHRLATELHDHIGQSLVFSKLKLDEIRKSVSGQGLAEAIKEVCDSMAQLIEDTRTLTFDLSSPILYELGFEAAVAEWLEDEVGKKHGIKTEFANDQQPKPLDDDIRTVLFRNVRELLTNVVKHAEASKVKISLSRADGNIRVRVADDGKGFDLETVASKAAGRAEFGLFSIRERLAQLGGSVDIASRPNGGTRILMTAPLKETQTDNAPQSD